MLPPAARATTTCFSAGAALAVAVAPITAPATSTVAVNTRTGQYDTSPPQVLGIPLGD
jgi:uncharacterized protein YraI